MCLFIDVYIDHPSCLYYLVEMAAQVYVRMACSRSEIERDFKALQDKDKNK